MEDKQLRSLINQMTLDEKIGQLNQFATPFYKGSSSEGQITGPMKRMGIDKESVQNSGSVIGASGAREIINIQKEHLKENRLGIPLLMMADVIHGYKTIFPVPLGIGCSWDLELAEKSAEIAAKEAAVAGVHVTFAPMVDLVRDPRWGRVVESTGEDPFLNSEFAKAQVKGFQGLDLKNDTKRVASCVKHFAAYGAPEGGRDYNTVNMSEREMREVYLPAYKAALDAGSEMVMSAFNTVDGIPATGNKKLMRDLLREEWGFDGVTISDWNSIKELIMHGVAEDGEQAAIQAINAGIDIDMMTGLYDKNLKKLVESGDVEEELIDEAVWRILKLKNKLGLFENPYRGADERLEKDIIMCDEHKEVAKDVATKSCVLLKNEGVLPLNKGQKIALIGPFAENNDILGSWSWLGSKDEATTLKDAMEKKMDSKNLIVAKGCDVESINIDELNEAIDLAKDADIIVLALGEDSLMSGEAGSLTDIRLPKVQLELVEKLKELDKPMVSVLFNGRPLDLSGVIEYSDSVMEAWYPGTEGGSAITELLFGDENPSGKLTMSFPYSVGQVPVYYNCFNTGRPKNAPDAEDRYVSQYLDSPNEPRFPFGFGLSYTTFSYSNASISSSHLTPDKSIEISVTIKNTGNRAGEEIVQLYIQDLVGEVVRPLKELKGFKKIFLQPKEEKKIVFTISEEHLRYHHSNLEYSSDPGKFRAYIGSNSRDVQSLSFELSK